MKLLLAALVSVVASASVAVVAFPLENSLAPRQVSPPLCGLQPNVTIVQKDASAFVHENCVGKLCVNLDNNGEYQKDSYVKSTTSNDCKEVKCTKQYNGKGNGAFGTGTCEVSKATRVILHCRNGATMRVTTSKDGKTIRWKALKKSKQGKRARISVFSDISADNGKCKQPSASGHRRISDPTDQVSLFCDATASIGCL